MSMYMTVLLSSLVLIGLLGIYLFLEPWIKQVFSKPLSFSEEGGAKCPDCGSTTLKFVPYCSMFCGTCGLSREFTHKEWMSLIRGEVNKIDNT